MWPLILYQVLSKLEIGAVVKIRQDCAELLGARATNDDSELRSGRCGVLVEIDEDALAVRIQFAGGRGSRKGSSWCPAAVIEPHQNDGLSKSAIASAGPEEFNTPSWNNCDQGFHVPIPSEVDELLTARQQNEIRAAAEAEARISLNELQRAADLAAADALEAFEAERARQHYWRHEALRDGTERIGQKLSKQHLRKTGANIVDALDKQLEITQVESTTQAARARLKTRALRLAQGPLEVLRLRRLNIVGVALSDAAAAILARTLSNPVPPFKTSVASSTNHTPAGLLAELVELRIVGAGFGQDGVIAIAGALPSCPNLLALDLTGSAASPSGLRAVAAAATAPHCGLRTVALSFNIAASDWSKYGLEDGVRAFAEALAHTRVAKLTISYAMNVLGSTAARTRRLQVTAAHFHLRKPRPLPDWLAKGVGDHLIDDTQVTLAINGRLNLYAARQRLALATVAICLCPDGWLHARCILRLVSRLNELRAVVAASPSVLGAALGPELRPWYRPPHHYIAVQSAVARQGLELSSRVVRNIFPGEAVAALELRHNRQGGIAVRFCCSLSPKQGEQAWVSLSGRVPRRPPSARTIRRQQEEARRFERERIAGIEAAIASRCTRREAELLAEQESRAALRAQAWLSDEMVDQLRKFERAAVDAETEFDREISELQAQLVPARELSSTKLKMIEAPKTVIMDSHIRRQSSSTTDCLFGQLDDMYSNHSSSLVADRTVDDRLSAADDVLALWPGATPITGDERKRLREAAAAAEAAASASRLAWALLEYRNSLTNAAAEFVFIVSQDGSWPIETAKHVFIIRFSAYSKVAFHDRATAEEAWLATEQKTKGGVIQSAPRMLRNYQFTSQSASKAPSGSDGNAEPRRTVELIIPERPRWQLEQTAEEIAQWLLEQSGVRWPAGWACCRLADVMITVRTEHELATLDLQIAEAAAEMDRLVTEQHSLTTRLPDLEQSSAVAAHQLALATIESKFADKWVDKEHSTAGFVAPMTVQSQETFDRAIAETDAARNHLAHSQQQIERARARATELADLKAELITRQAATVEVICVDFDREVAVARARETTDTKASWGDPLGPQEPMPLQQGTAFAAASRERERSRSSASGVPRPEGNLVEQALAVRCRLMEQRLPVLGKQIRGIEREAVAHQLAPRGQLEQIQLQSDQKLLTPPLPQSIPRFFSEGTGARRNKRLAPLG
eukprot:SAG31_NODE_236_length_19594_cov_7.018620_2_plen_1203_part_00